MTPNRRISAALSAPLLVLLGVAVAAPMATFFVYSFFTFEMRKAHPGFDLGSYSTALGEATYRVFAWNTLALAIPTTIASVAAGFALAYYIAFAAGKLRNTLLALVVFSMLGSYLVRIYAWRTLMGENGVINSTLDTLRVIDEPLHFLLFSRFAVIVGLTNLFVPFTTLLIYASLSGIPDGLLSASRDLGAGRAETLRRITLPLAGPAVLAASALTFFLAAGDYITPVLLGGTNSATFGTAISDQLRLTGNYALGGALSFVMLAAFAVAYLVLRFGFRAAGLLPRHGVAS